jgi:hypothetical protein
MNITRGTAAFTMNYGIFPWFSSVNNLVNIFSFYSERFFAPCAKKDPLAGWAHRQGGHEAADKFGSTVLLFRNKQFVNLLVSQLFLALGRVNHQGRTVGGHPDQMVAEAQQFLYLGLKF